MKPVNDGRFLSVQTDTGCAGVTVTLTELRCCHGNATGKVGQQAPATSLLAW